MKHLILAGLILLLITLVACGSPEPEAPQSQEVVVDCQQTLSAHQYLLKQHKELKGLYQRSQEKQGEYIAAINTLNSEIQRLNTKLAVTEALRNPGGYEELINEVARLNAEKKNWHILAKKESEAILAKYNAIKALFPPVNFPDDKALIKWRANSGNMSEVGCLGLQKRALADGYIVSVYPDHGYCVVIAGGYWYKITPSDKDLVEKIGKVK